MTESKWNRGDEEYEGLTFIQDPFTLWPFRGRAARGRGVDISNSAYTDTRTISPERADPTLPPNVSRFNGI